MQIDVVSIFPQYFSVLDISLLGKAEAAGLLDVRVHDLRDWASDKHRTVDDTPYGGGAGMVMRPDVWGKALDQIIGDEDVVLALPTPSGENFTQRKSEELTRAKRIVFAPGRYEGIDARLAQHYRSKKNVTVMEFSIGDYVLNGGEVASLVVIEAVGRLLDGVVGNPLSLVEESHSTAGLLEYPAFTKPSQWRGLSVPSVLLGGNHAAIARWRRDLALQRTCERRPDMIARLDEDELDSSDREVIAGCGLLAPPFHGRISFSLARAEQVSQLHRLAARTFPDACPTYLTEDAIADFVAQNLNEAELAKAIDRQEILVAQVGEQLVGYAWITPPAADGAVPTSTLEKAMPQGGAYLSKLYVDSQWRGSGIAGALLEAAIAQLLPPATPAIGLGTNQGNKRAQKFYRRHGFRKKGTRMFKVGGQPNRDVCMVRELTGDDQY